MSDPDRRNITDQRYAGDAALRYLAGSSRSRTPAQWLGYFAQHYGDTYEVCAPSAPGGQWKAIALFGRRDQLFGWSAAELLDELREHRFRNYPRPADGERG